MNKVTYNKLIRDNIPDIIRSHGAECEIEVLSDERFAEEVMRKIMEEASGLLQARNRTELLEELGDVMIVLNEIRKLNDVTEEEMDAAIEANIQRKGGFDKHQYLHWSSDDSYQTNERTHSD